MSNSIGKASGEGVISLGTEAWNIADGFTKIKILRLLIELDLYETIAKFGRKDIEEYVPFEEIPHRRLEGITRMIFSLKQLIGNCQFAIEKKDEEIITKYFERIKNVEEVIGGVARELNNDITKETILKINEDHFNLCFDILRQIKDELNVPINKAGLIFRQSGEIDLDKVLEDIYEGG